MQMCKSIRPAVIENNRGARLAISVEEAASMGGEMRAMTWGDKWPSMAVANRASPSGTASTAVALAMLATRVVRRTATDRGFRGVLRIIRRTDREEVTGQGGICLIASSI